LEDNKKNILINLPISQEDTNKIIPKAPILKKLVDSKDTRVNNLQENTNAVSEKVDNPVPVISTKLNESTERKHSGIQQITESTIVSSPIRTNENTNNDVHMATVNDNKTVVSTPNLREGNICSVEKENPPESLPFQNKIEPSKELTNITTQSQVPKPPEVIIQVNSLESSKESVKDAITNINNDVQTKKEEPKPTAQRISMKQVNKDIDEFCAKINKLEIEINNAYNIKMSDYFYDDCLPDTLKFRLVDDFFKEK